MGHEFHIEVDQLHMFSGHDWAYLGDLCTCECSHFDTKVIAWDPTIATYELWECSNCLCRAWIDGRYYMYRNSYPDEAAFWKSITQWRRPLVSAGAA